MNISTINASTFFLLSNGTDTVACTISFDDAWTGAVLKPDAPLKYNTPHIAVVTQDVKDAAGNAITTFTQWSFTTIPAPGALDTTFGISGNGLVRKALGAYDDRAYKAVIQKDGKIVTAGLSSELSLVTSPNSTTFFTIARFEPNGATDSTFNPPLATGKIDIDTGRALTITLQDDDKIIAAGSSGSTGTAPSDFMVIRLNANGSRDISFGSSLVGSVKIDMGSNQDYARAVAVQSNGMIVVAGDASDNNGQNQRAVIARLTASGALDASFGSGGTGTIVNTTIATASSVTSMNAYLVKIQPIDGKILVGGAYKDGAGVVSSYLMRYDTTGQADSSFGTAGVISIPSGTPAVIAGVESLSDGKIIVAGTASNSTNDIFLLRLNSDGTLDTTFGTNGVTVTDIENGVESAAGLAVQTDGKIIVSATYRPTTGTGTANLNFAAFRYTADGKLDTTFGTGNTGMVVTDFGTPLESCQGVVLQQDGKIILYGYGFFGSNDDIVLARYWP